MNRSFRYGDGIFETMRLHDGRLLWLKEHLARLGKGAAILSLVVNVDEIEASLQKVAFAIKKGRVRLHVWRDGDGAYLPVTDKAAFFIECFPLQPAEPAPVTLTDFKDVPLTPSVLAGLKTANGLPYILAAIHARNTGFNDALLYCDGFISEASSSNVFLVRGNKIMTPPLSSACLDGVMRRQVLRWCAEAGIEKEETRLQPKDLLSADALFLTNAMQGIVPVSRYREATYKANNPTLAALMRHARQDSQGACYFNKPS